MIPLIDENYARQIELKASRAKNWKNCNPGRPAKVQFNFPKKVMVIAPISVAIKNHFVSTDEGGLELVKCLWPWEEKNEPTVFMVRLALEFMDDPRVDARSADGASDRPGA